MRKKWQSAFDKDALGSQGGIKRQWKGRKMSSKFKIRNARMEDLPQIMPIYAYARKFMVQTGNTSQWKNNFPPEELLRGDIEKRQLYVIEEDGQIHGVFAFVLGADPTYAVIEDGAWRSDEAYGTIHRIAGDGKIHGILEQAVTFCEQKNRHLRIDTHEDNKVMQHLILKNGFERCGIIHIADGTPRIAYEKV